MTKLLPLLILLFSHSVVSHAAGSYCKGERLSSVEKLICSDTKLSEYDDHLSDLFHKTLALSTAQERRQVLDEQRRWQAESRDRCDSWICLHGAFQERLNALSGIYQDRWQTRIPDSILNELSRRSATPVEELKELLNNCSQSQMNMNYCTFRTLIEADSTMRSVLARKLEALHYSCHTTLKTSQSEWEKDRDSKCNKKADDEAESGSVRPAILNTCKAGATEQRTMQLRSIKSCDSIPNSMQ